MPQNETWFYPSSNRANFCKFTPHCFVYSNIKNLTLFVFRMGRREAKTQLPTSFSAVTSANVVMSPQNPLTFSFKSFASLVWNAKVIPNASPKLLNLNQGHLSKILVFLVKSLKDWGYGNLSYRNARVTKL